MKKFRVLTSLILALGILLMNVQPALAVPLLPSEFTGTVTVNGSPITTGTVVGKIYGVQYGGAATWDAGSYSLTIPSDDSDSEGTIEGGVGGNSIEFYVNGAKATTTSTWNSGTLVTLNLTVTTGGNPVPMLTSLSQTSATAGGAGFPLIVYGTNFNTNSKVRWNGSVTGISTTYISSTELKATIAEGNIVTAGTAFVNVYNALPGGGYSNPLPFTINNPVPTTDSLDPSSVEAGGAGFSLYVYGSGFIDGSIVRWNGADRTTGFSDSTLLIADITAADIATVGSASVTVFNPTPGGGTSTPALTFLITGPNHTVTFNGNGNTGGSMSNQIANVPTALTANAFTRTGYSFVEWTTAADGTGTHYANSATYPFTANATLYAQWIANPTHTVTYAFGGGTGTLPTQSPVSEGASFTVASGATLSRAGYTFAGWNDGSSTYAAGATYTMGVNNVTLTAVWTATLQTVTYSLNGGTGTLPTQAAVATGGTFNVYSGTAPTKAGYTFAGWNDGSSTYAAGATYTMGTSNVTLTAVWTATLQTVTYSLNGGTGTPPTQAAVATGGTFNVYSGTAPTKAGYTFGGWNDGTSTYAAGATYTMGTSNVTLTAVWTATLQTVTYSLNGGTGTLPTQAAVATGGTFNVYSGTAPTKAGYTFGGWNDGTSTYAAGATYTMGVSNVTLTAVWTATLHTVTYSLNGGTGTLPTQAAVATGGTFNVYSGTAPTKAGYTFGGWNDGTSTYAAGATYTMGVNNVTLTAVWTATLHTVTYSLNGGTGTLPTQAAVATGGTFNVYSGTAPTKAGYTFGGWNDGSSTYAAGATYTMGVSNVTLTAVWTATLHTVTYSLNGGTGTLPTQAAVATGGTFNVYSGTAPTKAGYTFGGWNDGTSTYAAGATYTMGVNNVTLTAVWTATLHTVTYSLNGGTGTLPTQAAVATGGTFNVYSGTAPTKAGYTFGGWNDGSSTYAAGATYTMGVSNVTLTAVWTATLQTVTYSLNGGTGTLPTQAAVATGGTFNVYSGTAPTKAGYTFGGWNDGTSTYAAGATYTMGVSNVTLTAVWTATLQTVTYSLNGGTGTLPTQAAVATGGTFSVYSGTAPTKAGYTFGGWNDGTSTYAAGATYTMGVSNVTLTAVWTATLHTVTYSLNGGTGTLPTQAAVATGGTFNVYSGTAPTKAGYTFGGWNDGSSTYAAGATYTMGVSNVTLTAVWTATLHTVTYSLNGGTGTPPTQAAVATGGTFNVYSGTAPTKAGYTFGGWNDGTSTYAAGATYTMGVSNVTLTAVWTATLQTVTYSLNGGTGTLPTQAAVATGGTFNVYSGTAPTKAGYTFGGWNDGTSTYAAGATYTMGVSNVTLTAVWTALGSHTVTYAFGGGTGTLPTQSPVSEGASFTVASSATLSRAGYTFGGWNDGTSTYAAGATYTMGTSNVTLTAVWTATLQTVTYSLNGGTGTLPTQAAVATGGTFNVYSGTAPTKAGYTFAGWNDGSSTYAAGATYTMGVSNVTLTAVWTATLQTVTYSLNGGTGTLPTQAAVATGGTFNVYSGTAPTKAGYTFGGWNDGTSTYAAGATYTMGVSNVTLTAVWTATLQTVTYSLNGGTGTLPTQAAVATGGTFSVYSGTAPTKAGYTFGGWNDGTSTYAAGATYTMGVSNVTLTAVWTATLHTVTYSLNGGTGTLPTQAAVATGGTFNVYSGTAPTKAGYTFGGWNDGTSTYAAGATYTMGTSNVTLTAVWTATLQTVTYANGGGTGTPPTQSPVSEGASFIVAANTFTRTGYTFAGWNDGTTPYAAGATYTMGISNVTLTAQWIANTYTVTFDGNNGNTPSPTSKMVTFGSAYGSLATTSRSGYTFSGWFTAASGGTQVTAATIVSTTSNHTLYAQWTAVPTHTVTFNSNGGTGTMAPQVANVPTALTLNTFTRTGYTFAGWNTLANGTGTNYTDGAVYSFSADITLYAKWTALPNHTVTFNSNGGTGTMAPQAANVPTALTLNSFTHTGYTFAGWNTLANGTGTNYTDGAVYSFSADITLYAKWTTLPPACYALNLSHTGQGSNPVATPTNSTGCTAGQYIASASISLSNAVPTSGWQISGWTGTNNNASTSNTNTVTMPASAHSASVNYIIIKVTPTLSVTNSPVTFNGAPQAAIVTGSVAGVVSNVRYDGSTTAPTAVGTYAVTADFVPTDTVNYNSLTGASAGNFVINSGTGGLGAGGDTTGVFRPSNGIIFLKNTNTSGFADIGLNYGLGGDYPITGDWDGNGTDTIGVYRNGSFYLRNSNTIGFAEIVFAFGLPGDQPVAGDWDGDGIDTIGVYRNGLFLLRNSNSEGTADANFLLGNPGDVGIAGDWDGDGSDTTGVFRPSNGVIFLKNANTSGFADVALNYGLSGDQPVMGDWDDDGIDTIGVYRNGQFMLRNSNTIGFAEIVFALGNPGDMPIAGNWDGIP